MGDRTESLASGAHERESVKGNTPGTENIFRIVMRKRKNELGHDDGNQDKLSKACQSGGRRTRGTPTRNEDHRDVDGHADEERAAKAKKRSQALRRKRLEEE